MCGASKNKRKWASFVDSTRHKEKEKNNATQQRRSNPTQIHNKPALPSGQAIHRKYKPQMAVPKQPVLTVDTSS